MMAPMEEAKERVPTEHSVVPIVIEPSGSSRPPRISGHRVVCTENYLYSFGGYAPDSAHERQNELVPELWRFHLYRNEWKRIQLEGEVPAGVASSAMTLLDDNRTLVLIGGTGLPFGTWRNRSVYYGDLQSAEKGGSVTLSKLADVKGTPPAARYGQALIAVGKHLYVVGGTDGVNYSMEVHMLDLKTRQWTTLFDDDGIVPGPPRRYRHEIAIFDNKLFVFGGGTPETVYGFTQIPVFDLAQRTWESVNSRTENGVLPPARRCHSAVQNGEWVVLAGGLRDKVLNDVWKFNLRTLRWKSFGDVLPQTVYFHAAAANSTGRMYIFGGVTSIDGSTRSDNVVSLDAFEPCLKEIALRLVLETMPHLFDCDRYTLSMTGLPYPVHDKIVRPD